MYYATRHPTYIHRESTDSLIQVCATRNAHAQGFLKTGRIPGDSHST